MFAASLHPAPRTSYLLALSHHLPSPASHICLAHASPVRLQPVAAAPRAAREASGLSSRQG